MTAGQDMMAAFFDRKSNLARPAISLEERELRSAQLLDAAVSLWLQNPERIPSVSEVAKRAGIAKGAVYLYFKSKEDLLLAVHERQIAVYFDAVVTRARSDVPMGFDTIMELTSRHLVEQPVFLPLATLIAGLLHKGVTPEIALEFEQRMAERLRLAGGLLCRHFRLPDELSGVRLLMRSFALILGLWQLIGSEQPMCIGSEVSAMLLPDYPSELHAALSALWKGTLNEDSNHA
ncbi:Fatty acid metabolism regulator protein [Ferriphaselus amnicola]|uniref:Fatty acid metabolism regulator protein n=1 Tax=Ferriphaselus amnicola TaxID=1188319 RepID=A0A2Z6GAZ1_9PROT|nr:TetR/AcrR family transcriptional regulator [Ferriphaselus amnicola]BBE50596.1 Fatty acid metabolism regulator protein [Ferriphaselus amnicola]